MRMRKLKWVLLLFIVVALFAGCDVWISFWGSGNGNTLEVQAFMSSTLADFYGGDRLQAIIYRYNGSSYYAVDRTTAFFGVRSLDASFWGLSDGDYFVSVWKDSDGDDLPDYGAEYGVTTAPFTINQDLVLVIQTDSDWKADGSPAVSHP